MSLDRDGTGSQDDRDDAIVPNGAVRGNADGEKADRDRRLVRSGLLSSGATDPGVLLGPRFTWIR